MATNLTMADNADITPYEGENIDATWTDTERDEVGLQAEAYVSGLLDYDAVTNWANLSANLKIILTEFVARTIAVQGIAFNMAGYTSRVEAEDMINLSLWKIRRIEKFLMEPGALKILGGAR